MFTISRRVFCGTGASAAASALAGCMGSDDRLAGGFFSDTPSRRNDPATIGRPDYNAVYSGYPGEPFAVQPFDYAKMDPNFLRQEVAYPGPHAPGTVVVDPASRYLYLVGQSHKATRYGVGVGREGFAWAGNAQINMRRSWPDWIPPREMVARDPAVRSQLVETPRGLGVPGGLRSPLGARAMYLFADHGDTGYRIHGTTEPETIGTNVSSGCVRMINQDIIHLYGRAPDGTKVVVLG